MTKNQEKKVKKHEKLQGKALLFLHDYDMINQ
jgi:hypothetical protein